MELGKYINKGARREVYEHPINPDWVIKKVRDDKPKAQTKNRSEYNVWKLANEIGEADLLVPCIELSQCEKYLIQLKGKKVTKRSHIPKKIYTWMGFDASSPRQWVKIDGKVLLCDYDASQLTKLQDYVRELKKEPLE